MAKMHQQLVGLVQLVELVQQELLLSYRLRTFPSPGCAHTQSPLQVYLPSFLDFLLGTNR